MSEILTLENKSRLSLGGVGEVGAFSEKEVTLRMKSGETFTVRGEGLKILSFSKESGEIKLDGKVAEMKFRVKKEFIKGLFK